MAIDTYVPPPPSAVLVKRVRDVLDRDFAGMAPEARMAADLAGDLATTPVPLLTAVVAGRLRDFEVAGRYGIAPVGPDDHRLSTEAARIPHTVGNIEPRPYRQRRV